MKRSIKFILLVLLLFSCKKVLALNVNQTDFYINPGNKDNVVLSYLDKEKIKELRFDITWDSYDVVAKLNSSLDYDLDGTKYIFKFEDGLSEKKDLGNLEISVSDDVESGIYNIKIWNISATNMDDDIIRYDSIDIVVNVTFNNVKNNTKYNFLERIDSNIVNINLIDNIFEYDVVVKNDVKELDLKPIVKDNSYKVSVFSQILNKDSDNIITIVVNDDYNHKQEYKINVKFLKEKEKIAIDDREFNQEEDYKDKWIIIGGVLLFVFGICLLTSKKK